MVFGESHRDMKPGSECNRQVFRFIYRVKGALEYDDQAKKY